jgi:hypothetical protein
MNELNLLKLILSVNDTFDDDHIFLIEYKYLIHYIVIQLTLFVH